MTAGRAQAHEIERAPIAAAPDPVGAPWAIPADGRARLRLALAGFALLCLWLFAHPYAGVIHDARLYVGRALADLDPKGLGTDLLFSNDGQSGFTLYRPLIRSGVIAFGPGGAALLATLVNLCLWFGAAAALLSRFSRGRMLAAALVAVAVLDPAYGGFDVFRYGEAFASPRPLAEAAVIAAMTCLAMRRDWLAAGFVVVAGVLHPVMALPGVMIVFIVFAARTPRLWFLPLVGAAALSLAAAFKLPLADRLFTTVDPEWMKVLLARTPYLFATWWRPGDWGRLFVQAAVVGLCLAGSTGRLRTLLTAVLVTAAIGVAATLVLCDGFGDLLGLQLQPWRALWPMAVLANAALPLVALALWRRGSAGRTALGLLLMAWLVCEYGWGGLASSFACLVGIVLILRRYPPPPPWLAQAVLVLAGPTAAIEFGQSIMVVVETLKPGLPDGVRVSMLQMWRSGALPALSVLSAGAAAWIMRDRLVGLRHLAPLAVVAALAELLLLDDRPTTQRRVERGRPDAVLNAAIGPTPGSLLWVGGDAQPWLLARRGAWANSIQGASVVFSRPLAMAWEDRIRRIIGVGFATEADRSPFTPAKHFARGMAREGAIKVCGWPDAPAALLITGHRPIPEASYWRPDPPETRLGYNGKRFAWSIIGEYTVVRCDRLRALKPEAAAAVVSPSAGGRG
ncbi:hypothetical protein BH09PSE2_BH09PSE2_04860 [soil metagenome]